MNNTTANSSTETKPDCGCVVGKQLITIDLNGGITGLDFKKKGFDIATLGPVRKQRSTDIKWSEYYQQWFVFFLTGTRAGTTLTSNDLVDDTQTPMRGLSQVAGGAVSDCGQGTLLFREYDDAVAAEVVIIQHWRSTGNMEAVL